MLLIHILSLTCRPSISSWPLVDDCLPYSLPATRTTHFPGHPDLLNTNMSSEAELGLHPDVISHPYVVFITVASVMTTLSTASVALRFIQRCLRLELFWDDWAALTALVFAMGFLICTVLVATVGGAGYHITTYSERQLEKYLQVRDLLEMKFVWTSLTRFWTEPKMIRSRWQTMSFTMPLFLCRKSPCYFSTSGFFP